MEQLLEIVTKVVQQGFKKAGYDDRFGILKYSDRSDLCDFQCNDCFAIAKAEGTSPMVVAEYIKSFINHEGIFKEVAVVKPGFLNFTLHESYVVSFFNEMMNHKEALFPNIGNQEAVVIDYGGANVAKPLHIGHLRSAVIGESIKRIAAAGGYKVLSDVHLGDWGLQMGLVITELKEVFPKLKQGIDEINTFDITPSLLNELYPRASAKSKASSEYKKEAQEATAKLQQGDQESLLLWKKILEISKASLYESYKSLGVTFDYWYGESDASAYVPRLIEILEAKHLLEESDQARVVRVTREDDPKELPPAIIVKSDGSSIYATTDLATIIQRNQDFTPTKIWYVVDNRQSLHFEQVFRVARKASLVNAETELEFLGFGTMNGKDGKPYKTRDGGVMQLDDLVKLTMDKVSDKIDADNFETSQMLNDAIENIAIAAIKFGDLVNYRSKDYVFDIDKFISFEGKTGTYILYSITRINSILSKFDDRQHSETRYSAIETDIERNLIMKLVRCPDIHVKALKEKSPNLIAENAYQIAVLFSRFYASNNITMQQDALIKENWINLLTYVKTVLEFELYLLGIQTVTKM